MRKFIVITLVAVGLMFTFSSNGAQAHVLISDIDRRVGVVLHITPDDDPVAGEPSSLFFDIQDKAVSEQTYSFTLTVTDPDGKEHLVPISVIGSTVAATYVFPSQAAYKIMLKAEPTDITKKLLYFEQAQRISRGTIEQAVEVRSHQWAEIGIIASVCGMLVLGIIGYNKREDVKKYVTKHGF